jgi:predicted dehydrogenase
MANRRKLGRVIETGEMIAKTAEDQIAVTGVLESGAVASVHYRGGASRGVNLLWEINGTEGDLQLSDPAGHGQMHDVAVWGGRGREAALQPLPIPRHYYCASPEAAPGVAFNVAQTYLRLARDLEEGSRSCPTFEDAVIRHRMLEAIERSASTGRQTSYARE